MELEPGSGFFDNCTCVNRYYNNGMRCEDCNVDFSCVGGRQHVSSARVDQLSDWTNTFFDELAWVLQVSIVDAVLLHQFSVAVPLELRRGAALAFLPGAHTYDSCANGNIGNTRLFLQDRVQAVFTWGAEVFITAVPMV